MHEYMYDGPVYEFERCISNRWIGRTMAKSEKQARNNLTYQFKQRNNRLETAKISLPGEITMTS